MEEGQSPPEKKNNKKVTFALISLSIILIILLLGAYYLIFVNKSILNSFSKSTPSATEETERKVDIGEVVKTTPRPPSEASFTCEDSKTIDATFYSEDGLSGVDLVLSDGVVMSLYQVESASGAKYANEDGYVFWNSGDEAFMEKDGEKTYSNCQIKS